MTVAVSLYGCLNLILCLYVQVHHGSERTCAQGGPWLQTIGFYSTGDPLSPPSSFSPVGICTYIPFISECVHGHAMCQGSSIICDQSITQTQAVQTFAVQNATAMP